MSLSIRVYLQRYKLIFRHESLGYFKRFKRKPQYRYIRTLHEKNQLPKREEEVEKKIRQHSSITKKEIHRIKYLLIKKLWILY